MNEYFQTGAVPAPSSPGASSVMRQEFANIAAGFDKLPVLSGHQGEIVFVDATGSRLETNGTAVTDFVTLTGAQTVINKTIAWANNTFPGFGTGATKNAGTLADNVLLLVDNNKLPALDAGNLINIPGLSLKADSFNAVLTGAPTCPTPPTGDSGARVANTQFVSDTLQAIGTFAPSNATPIMDGSPVPGSSPLGSRGDHVHPTDTSRAPASAGTGLGTSFTPAGNIAATNVQDALVELDGEKAPLASPALTGNPTAPTPTPGDNDTSIATTAFVQAALTSLAPLASPTFTGDPKAPTTATSDNDTSIATTAFVHSLLAQQPVGVQVSNSNPLVNGVVSPGVGVDASRYDHIHPVDTSRAPASASTAVGTTYTPTGSVVATNVQAAVTELDADLTTATKGPAFGATASANQSISVGSRVKLAFNTETFDTNANYVPASARFTPTVAGYYHVSCSAKIDEIGVGAYGANMSIDKNAASAVALGVGIGDTNYKTGFSCSGTVYMNGTTDYLEAFAQTLGPSGSLLILGVNFSAHLVRLP